MRHRVLQFAALMVLVVLNASGAPGVELDMPSPRVTAIGPDHVKEKCGKLARIGCTSFSDFTLVCNCELKDDVWRVEAVASAVPQIYLSNFSHLGHEMTHIADFRHMLTTHLGAIEKRQFDTRASCETYARGVTRAFPDTMRRIGKISTVMRDNRGRETSEDHLVVMKAEVMPQFMDHRLADLAYSVAPGSSDAQNRAAEDRDLVGQYR